MYVMCYQENWGPVLEFFISLRKELERSQFRRKLENTFTSIRERENKGEGRSVAMLAASQEETEKMQR